MTSHVRYVDGYETLSLHSPHLSWGGRLGNCAVWCSEEDVPTLTESFSRSFSVGSSTSAIERQRRLSCNMVPNVSALSVLCKHGIDRMDMPPRLRGEGLFQSRRWTTSIAIELYACSSQSTRNLSPDKHPFVLGGGRRSWRFGFKNLWSFNESIPSAPCRS